MPIYAQNEKGYLNLLKLLSIAHLESETGLMPEIGLDDLLLHSSDLILLSGGPDGPVGRALLQGNKELAIQLIGRLQTGFDGRFYIDGDVFDMDSRANLTEARRQSSRVALIRAVRDDQAIVFSPKGYLYTINVFTDIDCTYCRKLHSEIAELNRLGVRVRYLMYPRSGPGSEAWQKAESVWCSPDRNDALTRAKRGEAVEPRSCENPVAAQYELGRELGIRGTPGIITDNGEYITGYLPAPRLVEHLKALATAG